MEKRPRIYINLNISDFTKKKNFFESFQCGYNSKYQECVIHNKGVLFKIFQKKNLDLEKNLFQVYT